MTEQNKNNDSGKKKSYNFDVDRMIDEGLAGGTVDNRYQRPHIDESRPVEKEEKPRKAED
ncbi:hypothetical protein JOD45_002626 [Scopulibacillus daqui]|uniref:Uncharacterized protein n=1 Tax=Scopulibacillus daqui TaxID=1469162 RepID=A0ABS2Q283_9BACL|nr:hypothetical protein [Scopulibacillus daqui]MBM7646398.1 hypothetical protein [Scopulibacillus daqui]